MNIILTMAGKGSRFAVAGYETPKPFIEMPDGRKMLEWPLSQIERLENIELYIVLQREYLDERYGLHTILKNCLLDTVNVVPLDEVPNGQALSAFEAIKHINEGSVLIAGCDTVEDFRIFDLVRGATSDSAGAVTFFDEETGSDHFSFVKYDQNMNARDIVEKKRISNNALAGSYFFRNHHYFLAALHSQLAQTENQLGEVFVAPVYQPLIKLGYQIECLPTKNLKVFGTPDELHTISL